MDNNKNIVNLIRDIVFYYIKYYYDKYLEEHNCNEIEKSILPDFVNKLYIENTIKLKDYIRKSLKKNLKEEYNKTIVENILMEMFEDVNYCKNRIIDEIILYQDSNKESNKESNQGLTQNPLIN